MLDWVSLAIFAALIWAGLNVLDKFLVTAWVRNLIIPVAIQVLVGALVGIVILVLTPIPAANSITVFWSLVSGGSFLLMSAFYYKALQREEVSRAIPVFYTSPVFVALLAMGLVGEVLSASNYMGIALVVAGAFLVSFRGSIQFNRPFWYMLLAALALAVSLASAKFLLEQDGALAVFAFTRLGAAFLFLPFLLVPKYRKPTIPENHRLTSVFVLSVDESLNLMALALVFVASALGPVTLVNGLASLQPLFVLGFVLLISRFSPMVLKEQADFRTVLTKLSATAFIVIGAILLVV